MNINPDLIMFFDQLSELNLDDCNGNYQQYLYDHFLALDVSFDEMTVSEFQSCFILSVNLIVLITK